MLVKFFKNSFKEKRQYLTIKIIKCSNNSYWYKDYLGRIIDVNTFPSADVYGISFPLDHFGYMHILKEDCEILQVR